MIKLEDRLPNGSEYRLVKEEYRVVRSLERVLVDNQGMAAKIDWHGKGVDPEDVDSKAVASQAVPRPPLLLQLPRRQCRRRWSVTSRGSGQEESTQSRNVDGNK